MASTGPNLSGLSQRQQKLREQRIMQLLGDPNFGVRFGDLHPQKGSESAMNRQMAELAVDRGIQTRFSGGGARPNWFGPSPYDSIAAPFRAVNAARLNQMQGRGGGDLAALYQQLLGG